ncbi:TIGR03032 family protein [Tropicibacter naphthalenivorans]|uniref:Conserved hypothetical protein CHP03032 domain-containing protein n=1 Tax=Tropicibacter naphthalenivorans TaxID=441103 RepID=A0A0P1GKS4_9RHOB|nr:TIGR03032 family protein [Tropicibacter naphthalenivorans]CUH82676.1 hypothetical protein TRN7648_04219 [Tropicibacter naphthalenivorans]SMD11998.1 TIGR03032 family protein [Tropicibacter naphthalenivorans]
MEFTVSRNFTSWLANCGISLAFTAYEVGRLMLLGHTRDGRVSLYERHYPRCMGLHATSSGFYMGGIAHIWRFQDFGPDYAGKGGYDAAFLPVQTWTVGDLDIHDVTLDGNGAPIFASTNFNCIAGLSETASFRPIWKPPFIDRLVYEDRCHLNGLTCAPDGALFATAFSKTNSLEGWRNVGTGQGVIFNVSAGEDLAQGLTMPHSPRVQGEHVYFLESGTGLLKRAKISNGSVDEIALIPGYCRGLSFLGGYAIVASSTEREGRSFDGLPLSETLAKSQQPPRCGLFIVNLSTGAIEHYFQISGEVSQIFDVCVIQGCTQPMLYGANVDQLKLLVKPGVPIA